MGVYLSEPVTEKTIKEGSGKGFTFCMAEMQGKTPNTQVGGRTWRTHPSTRSNWATAMLFSLSSMDMEVLTHSLRP